MVMKLRSSSIVRTGMLSFRSEGLSVLHPVSSNKPVIIMPYHKKQEYHTFPDLIKYGILINNNKNLFMAFTHKLQPLGRLKGEPDCEAIRLPE